MVSSSLNNDQILESYEDASFEIYYRIDPNLDQMDLLQTININYSFAYLDSSSKKEKYL